MQYYTCNCGYRQPITGFSPGGFYGQFFSFPQATTGQFGRPPFGPPGSPPFGPPGGPSFGPPGIPPSGPSSGGSSSGPPSGPPPSFVPSQAAAQQGPGTFAVDPGAIRPCTFRYVYLWLDNGQRFWAWLVFVGPRSAAGWRWIGFRWVYFGIDLKRIVSFICY